MRNRSPMQRGWRVISGIALVLFLVGIMAVGVGFFTGSSPTALQAHGHLTEYGQRLSTNWAILKQDLEGIRQTLVQWFSTLPI